MDTYREAVLKELNIYSEENITFLFEKAIRLLGFPGPAAERESIDSIVDSANLVNVRLKDIPSSFDSQKLYPAIRSTIAAYKDQPSELEFFICDIIAKFGGISRYLYPIPTANGFDSQIAAFTILASTQHYHPADSILNEWRKYELYCDSSLEEWALNKAVDYRLELYQKFIGTEYHRYVCILIDTLHYVASIIDAALLECGCDQDYFYFQKAANSVLTYELDAIDLYTSSGVNSERIKKKWFERSFYQDVPPSDLLLWDLRTEIAEYRATGVWNMTRDLYIKVIAAPEDVRKGNLSQYLKKYKDYVYLLNEDQSIRELCPVFYDLYELWDEVRFFLKNDTYAPHPCRDMAKLLREQFVHHLAFAYFVYLTNSKSTWYDIYALCPGVKKKEVEDFLCEEYHFMTHEDFAEHEKELPSIGKRYEPFPGFYPKEVPAVTNKPIIVDPVASPKLGNKEYTELSVICQGEPYVFDSIELTKLSGVWEVDRLCALDLQDNPDYSVKDFQSDLAAFSRKCSAIAESEISLKKKETWIARILNILLEAYCAFDIDDKKQYVSYVIQFAAKMDAIFMEVPDQVCVRRVAQEIGDPLIFEHLDPNVPEEGKKNADEQGLDPLPWEESFIFEDIGSSLTYHERRMCRDCDEKKCRFRFGVKKYFGDVDYGFGNPDLENEDEETAETSVEKPEAVPSSSEPIDYIKDCHKVLCSEEVIVFLDCVALYLTVTPEWAPNYYIEEELEDFIKEHLTPPWPTYYRNAEGLEAQLTERIKALKDDELELSNFIDGFLSPFYDVAWTIRPYAETHADYQRLIVLRCVNEFFACTLDEYKAIISEAADAVVPTPGDSEKECFRRMLKELLDRAPEKIGDAIDPALGAIHGLYVSLKYVEEALESALLKAGIKNDYLFYEDEVGVDLGRALDYMCLCHLSKLSPHVLYSRVKKYGHRTDLECHSTEETLHYLERIMDGVKDGETKDGDATEIVQLKPQQSNSSKQPKDSESGEMPTIFPPEQVGKIVLSEFMITYLTNAKSYFKDGRWRNNNKFEYAVFMKAFYKVLHGKEGEFNVRWSTLPIFPLQDGTIMTPRNLTDALRPYDPKVHGGLLLRFVNALKS